MGGKLGEDIEEGFRNLIGLSITQGEFYFNEFKTAYFLGKKFQEGTVDKSVFNRYIHILWTELIEDGEDLELWQNLNLRKFIYYYSHKSLACFRLAEFVPGIIKTKKLMEKRGIPHDYRLEKRIMDRISSNNEDHIENKKFLRFYDETRNLENLIYNRKFKKK